MTAKEYIKEKEGEDHSKDGHICYNISPNRLSEFMEQYTNDKIIEVLSELGKTLYKNIGTDSYETRCIISDLKEKFKPSVD